MCMPMMMKRSTTPWLAHIIYYPHRVFIWPSLKDIYDIFQSNGRSSWPSVRSGIEEHPRGSPSNTTSYAVIGLLAVTVPWLPRIFSYWSGWQDSNLRHLAPKASTLDQTELHPDIFIDAALTRYLYIKHYPWFVLYTFLTWATIPNLTIRATLTTRSHLHRFICFNMWKSSNRWRVYGHSGLGLTWVL